LQFFYYKVPLTQNRQNCRYSTFSLTYSICPDQQRWTPDGENDHLSCYSSRPVWVLIAASLWDNGEIPIAQSCS